MDSLLRIIGAIVLVVLFIAGLALLLAFPTMWIVNYLFTDKLLLAVFGTPTISFWKALWLNFFFGIAFKSSISSSKRE